jgi:YidC/Oxa1 family membrane protein insertase
LSDFIFVLSRRELESSGWAFFEIISQGFGFIINILFDMVHRVGPANSLGISIVLMTIIFRFLIMPLSLKSQKSMMKMRELQPELNKIKEKYGNSKDPEIMRKYQQEQSALLAKHGANPLSGCLPMLIQMPLFIGLNAVMRQAALYISSLGNMYENLAEKLIDLGLVGAANNPGILMTLSEDIIPSAWRDNLLDFAATLSQEAMRDEELLRQAVSRFDGDLIILGLPEHLARVISRFGGDDWSKVFEYISEADLPAVQSMVNELTQIQTFLGVSIVEPSGWALPGIIIPILTGISMFISSWIMQQRTFDPNADERAVMTQKMMLFVMPFMMAFFTIQLVAAVGVFWITGQIFQSIQDIIMLKKSGTPIRLPFSKPLPQVVNDVPKKKKK